MGVLTYFTILYPWMEGAVYSTVFYSYPYHVFGNLDISGE